MTTLEKNFHIESLISYLIDYGNGDLVSYFIEGYGDEFKKEMPIMAIELKQLLSEVK